MALKKFEEYAKDFTTKKSDVVNTPTFNTLKNIQNKTEDKPLVKTPISEKSKVKDLKTSKPTPTPVKIIKENSFLVGSDYKVKIVIDVPQSLVQEYINKVKEETDKDPLDNFSEAEIAEQIITFLIKQNLVIDNLTPEFTVGSENVGSSEKSQETVEDDADELSDDLGGSDTNDAEDGSDGDIEFKDFDDNTADKETLSDDETADSSIEFDDNETEKKDLGEERQVDNKESDPDSNFEEIEFSDDNEDKPKTVGDLKTTQGQKVETQHKDEEKNSSEEEEEIEDLYKNIGYKVGYYETINFNNLKNR